MMILWTKVTGSHQISLCRNACTLSNELVYLCGNNPAPMQTTELQAFATQVRRDILRMIHAVQSGHPGGSLGCADFFATLYNNVLQHNPAFNMDGVGEDLFVLSNGHISAVWYSTLARTGYFPVAELATFRKLNTRLQGHPTTHDNLPGIRIASGSLGQGLSVAAGAALSKRINGDNRLVYCLMGDGELNEGQIWEAAMFATHHKVDNLIGVVDYNGKQIDGDTTDVMDMGNLAAKWSAFGWTVVELADGNDVTAIETALNEAKALCGKGKPVVIILKTIMGKGVDFMEDDYKWHGSPPSTEQLERALAQLPETLGDY